MPDSTKPSDWSELTHLTHGAPVVVERVRLEGREIAIEGRFELPQLARLPLEDQVFITAFVRTHGSIKEMEKIYGVSYPTIKSRLTRIANSLEFIEVSAEPVNDRKNDILDRLHRGEITPDDAIRALEDAS